MRDIAQLARQVIGVEIGGYRIANMLGSGGMGAVFLATHKSLSLRTAIKVMLPHEQESSTEPAAEVQRFLDEAQALSAVRHSSIVTLHDVGTLADGTIYMQMELLEGESLGDRLKRLGPLPLGAAVEFARQMAAGLEVVHERGIIHRDLKPHNVFIVSDREAANGERAKLLDFGIAKFQNSLARRTHTGQIIGTPRYMSPEQCESINLIDDRTDVYSLGLLLFEMATGVSPYEMEEDQPLAWLYVHVHRRPRTLGMLLPQVPTSLDALLTQMLDKLPEQRPSMAEIERRLRRSLDELGAAEPSLPSVRPVSARVDPHTAETEEFRGAAVTPSPSSRFAIWDRLRRWWVLIAVVLGLVGVSLLLHLVSGASPAGRWSKFFPQLGAQDRSLSADELEVVAAASHVPPGMAFVPGRSFVMGSTKEEAEDAYRSCAAQTSNCELTDFLRELPAHVVTVSSFYLDKREVTNQQFAAALNLPLLQVRTQEGRKVFGRDGQLIIDLHPDYGGIELRGEKFVAMPSRAELPVTQVTWYGARQYCESQGQMLPTEAQWELAARELTTRRSLSPDSPSSPWPWGSQPPRCDGVAAARDKGGACEQPTPGPAAVGSSVQDVTALGIYDLGGNVREWVQDRYAVPYPSCKECKDPVLLSLLPGATDSGFRVVRGGTWALDFSRGRSKGRARFHENSTAITIGFRCAAAVVR